MHILIIIFSVFFGATAITNKAISQDSLGALFGKSNQSTEASDIRDHFFQLYNDEDFQNIYSNLLPTQIQASKNEAIFLAKTSKSKQKTGNFLSAQQTGMAAGFKQILSSDGGTLLEKPLSLSTVTRKWRGQFHNGQFYISIVFFKEDNVLHIYEITISDDQLNPTFKSTM